MFQTDKKLIYDSFIQDGLDEREKWNNYIVLASGYLRNVYLAFHVFLKASFVAEI